MSILIPLDRIEDSPFQTRQSYDEAKIQEIAASIDRDGLIQVPVGRIVTIAGSPVATGQSWTIEHTPEGLAIRQTFPGTNQLNVIRLGVQADVDTMLKERPGFRIQIAVGHTRLRAFRHLGRDAMPVELRPLTDEQMDMLAWHENHDRSDLNPVEEACAIRDRIDRHGWTQTEASERLGIDRSTISNKLRLLELPAEVLEHVATGELSERKAMALLPIFQLSEDELAMIVRRRPGGRPGR